MAVQSNSVKNRKKKAKLSTKNIPHSNYEEANSKAKRLESQLQLGTSNSRSCIVHFVYIIAFVIVLSSLSWLILCNTLCKDLEFCSLEFLALLYKRPVGNFINGSKADSVLLESETSSVPKFDVSLWVVERRSNLSLNEFIDKYDGKRPVLVTDALKNWKANKWNKEFLVKNYGDQQVVMKAVHGSLSQAESLALPMKLFAKHSHEGASDTWTYVEDELFIQLHPELRKHLGKPIYLEEDFFQIFPKEVRPWNAMLLWGTAYSRSYLHIDPYNWTGTNAVFSGKKLWKLYPPGQDEYLYVIPNRKSEFPLNCYKYNSPIDAFNPDLKKYPEFSKARAISFEQRPGELLIIPPGWFHQAFNAVETIAVSSQVMNSQNYHIVLEEIFKAGNIDRRILPSDFHQLPAVEQVMFVVNSLSSEVIQRGRHVTNEILQQMGYPTK